MNKKNDLEHRRIINKRSLDKKRKWIYENISDCCMLCGYNKCDTALELHHTKETEVTIKRREKKGNIQSGWKMRWDDLKADAPYMVLLCANCHREVHNGMHPEIPVPEHLTTMERFKGAAPYGYEWVDKKIIKDPDTFEIRQRIISLNESGLNYSQITRILNDDGILTKHQRKWTPVQVMRICNGNFMSNVDGDET